MAEDVPPSLADARARGSVDGNDYQTAAMLSPTPDERRIPLPQQTAPSAPLIDPSVPRNFRRQRRNSLPTLPSFAAIRATFLGNGSDEPESKTDDNDQQTIKQQASKALQVENLKLQHRAMFLNDQMDKYRQRVKQLQSELEESKQTLVTKDETIEALDARMKTKIKQIQSELKGRDKVIQRLEQQLTEQAMKPKHKRKETPGGYTISLPGVEIKQNGTVEAKTPEPEHPLFESEEALETGSRMRLPNLTPTSSADIALSHDAAGLPLHEKLRQRPDWQDVQARGVLLDNPESRVDPDMQQQHRTVRKRRASRRLEEFLPNRPNTTDLTQKNIIKDEDEPNRPKARNSFTLEDRLRQRPNPNDIQSRGVLLEDPRSRVDHALHANQRTVHRRRASQKIEDFLDQRPDWQDLHARGLLLDDPKAKVGADVQKQHRVVQRRRVSMTVEDFLAKRPDQAQLQNRNIMFRENETVETKKKHKRGLSRTIDEKLAIRPNPEDIQFLDWLKSADSLLAASGDTDDIEDIGLHLDPSIGSSIDRTPHARRDSITAMEDKLAQRPTIDETIARGILFDRPDSRLDHDLLAAHRNLHLRRASQNIEKMLMSRPQKDDLDRKQITYDEDTMVAKQKHKRKVSQDLENKLNPRRRPSMTDLQNQGISIAMLFTGDGLIGFSGLQPPDSEEDEKVDESIGVGSLFSSSQARNQPDFLSPQAMEDEEFVDPFDREFDPDELDRNKKENRLNLLFGQRSSVADMYARGIIFDHPCTSPQLLQREQKKKRSRASQTVSHLLSSRPDRDTLESKNILLKQDETVEKKKRHKRKLSEHLDSQLQTRPSPMQLKERGLAYIDFGGILLAIPFPPSLDEIQGSGGRLAIEAPDMMGHRTRGSDTVDVDADAVAQAEQLEELEDKIAELEDELRHKDDIIEDFRSGKLKQLKQENSQLRSELARASLNTNTLDAQPPASSALEDEQTIQTLSNEVKVLDAELRQKSGYINKLRYQLEQSGVELPDEKQVRRQLRKHLKKHLKHRPSADVLQSKNILMTHFHDRPEMQRVKSKMHFRQKSELVDNFLQNRPAKEMLKDRNILDDSAFKIQITDAGGQQTPDVRPEDFELPFAPEMSPEIQETRNPNVLRGEIARLHDLVSETTAVKRMLEKENESLRDNLQTAQMKQQKDLREQLGRHSLVEENFLDIIAKEMEKDKLEDKQIEQLKAERERLKEKMSTIQEQRESEKRKSNQQIEELTSMLEQQTTMQTRARQQTVTSMTELKEFVEWSRRLSWPDAVLQIFSDEYVDTGLESEPSPPHESLMSVLRHVWRTYRQHIHDNIDDLKHESEDKEKNLIFQIDDLQRQIKSIKAQHHHKISMVDEKFSAPFSVTTSEAAIAVMNDPNKQRILELEREIAKMRKEHREDKLAILRKTSTEIERLRIEFREMGRHTRARTQAPPQQSQTYMSYLSSYVWGGAGAPDTSSTPSQ